MRFSRDGKPYKTHISAGVDGYYISLSAMGLYVGTGMYKPEPAVLMRFRDAIARDASGRSLDTIVKTLRRKGYEVGTHDSLRSTPKGFPADHPRIDLLRMKDIFAGRLTTAEPWLATAKALDRIKKTMADVRPLRDWLRKHVTKT
jgi:uncharacterized protein (TIGR02453 family)